MDVEVLRMFTQESVLIPAIVAIAVVLIVVANCGAGVIKTIARERTRRDIAAFVSEGSMTPEQGERLLKAGKQD